jgi:GAF domain-containing protein/HAMP domain-containing protein
MPEEKLVTQSQHPTEGAREIRRTYQRINTIRFRLPVSFVLVVLLSLVVISVVLFVVSSQAGRRQAINQLESVARIKEAEIQGWMDSLENDLRFTIGGDQVSPRMLLLWQTDSQEHWMRDHLQQMVSQNERLEELFLIDLEGQVVLSSDPTQERRNHAGQTYFQEGLKRFYVQSPAYSSLLGRPSVIAALPVLDPDDGHTLGILAGRVDADTLSEIMGERAWLGDTGEIYLVDSDYGLLSALRFDETHAVSVRTQDVVTAIETRGSGSLLYNDYRGVSVVGVYHWLPELEIALLAKQDQTEALSITNSMLRVIGFVALGVLTIAVVAALFIARSIATPLSNLTETTVQIAAGDLSLTARVERQDEIGTLAQAFNSMTGQLRNLIGGLEKRVAERTYEVELHSAYLEAAAEVGRAANSILDPTQLIQQTVELIRERFGLYYVGMFLVDETGEWAMLRAGTGKAGQAMLARGHRIKVGEGMIGWSVAHAEARVALEVGEDAMRLATAELPETRSEAAIPLRSRGRVLGSLTVQDARPGTFTEDVITVLQMMADQVAVALDNAHLFAESQEALEAERRAYGELSREAWTDILYSHSKLGFLSNPQGVSPLGDQRRSEMEMALRTGQMALGENDSASLVMPVKVREQVVALVGGRKPQGAGEWTAEEITLVEAVTEQLSLALESARLYHDTQHRAARERVISQVTARMRESPIVKTVLKTAAHEIGEALGLAALDVRLGTEELPGRIDRITNREDDAGREEAID